MDQIRVIVNVLWRERFWVLSVLGTIVALACWYLASGDLDVRFAKRRSEIDGQFQAMKTLYQQPVCPNEDVNKGDFEQAKIQRDHVLQVWKDLYERQRREVLFWPKDKVLGKEFVDYIERLQFGDPIDFVMRGRYQNYIEERFDGLLEIVKAKKSLNGAVGGRRGGFDEGDGGPGGGFRGAGNPLAAQGENEDYLVQWLDQAKLQAQLDFKKKPTDIQIWVTQEDLWVYETLLHVIANTNKERGATRPDNTAVRVIVALEVGRPATEENRKEGKILMPKSSPGGLGGEPGFDGGEDGLGFGGGPSFEGGMDGGFGGPLGDDASVNPAAVLDSRYIDGEDNPYPGDAESFGVEFRQLPIRMVLMMDQQWIPQVLLECANAALPVEVKQLRINPSQSGVGFGGMNARASSRSIGIRGLPKDSTLAEVEIRGRVYIYNEPSNEQLHIPGDDTEQLADASSETL